MARAICSRPPAAIRAARSEARPLQRRVVFNRRLLPYLLLVPQLAITAAFFFWPAGQALHMSVLQHDPFGARVVFVGLENFRAMLADPD
jgi:sn-glycerol 3-phosphate transport system permease protein